MATDQAMREKAQRTVRTVGHSRHTLDGFIQMLTSHHVDVLVDVRSSPFSAIAPQFSKTDLEREVRARGLRYLFLGKELGGRPTGKAPTTAAEKAATYEAMRRSSEFWAAIDRIVDGAERFNVAIMCSEEDPTSCHRQLLVGPALEERGATVSHLRADGREQPNSDFAAARLKLSKYATSQLTLLPADDG